MLKTIGAHFPKTMSRLSAKTWFPHVPIAIAVALLGLLHLIPVIDQAIGLQAHFTTPGTVREDLVGITLPGIAQLAISLFAIAMAIGIWFRLRIAWLLSLLAALIGLGNLLLLAELPVEAWLFGYDIALIGVLLATSRYFDRSSMRNGTLVALVAVAVLVGYAVLGTYHLGDQFSPPIDTLMEASYLSVVTISTVGFGDFTPQTSETRLFITSIIILSLTVFSTAVGATLIPSMVHKFEQITRGRHTRVIRNDHYIIVGYSALASNTYHELVARQQQVTLILRSEPDKSHLALVGEIDIVIGDGSDLETLRAAGAEKAKAILALLDDDSENAFVILAAKELNAKAKTVAAVNDAKHLNRIRRVHPDLVIAPQVLGGELLTSMLTGEKIDVTAIMRRLLGHTDAKPTGAKTD